MTVAPAKSPLRPRGEVRRLLLDAARALFAERGYAGTSTRAIAEEAGVANSLLHRHFSTKAQLFEEAVFDPFATFIGQVVSDWEERSPLKRTLEDECRFFVTGLYDALSEHRQLVLALIAGDVYESELQSFASDEHDTPVARLLDRLTEVTETEIRGRGLTPVGDVGSIVGLTFG
ncbi:MAG TPA: helix-turn-helix domain-containing protein, partial [Pseudonocardia sp.]